MRIHKGRRPSFSPGVFLKHRRLNVAKVKVRGVERERAGNAKGGGGWVIKMTFPAFGFPVYVTDYASESGAGAGGYG